MTPQETVSGPCDICMDTGRDPKNRKRSCPTCDGQGRPFCYSCHQPIPCGGIGAVDGSCHNLRAMVSPGVPEQLIFKVQDDGNRTKIHMEDVRAGDKLHFASTDASWRQVNVAAEDSFMNERGIWCVMVSD